MRGMLGATVLLPLVLVGSAARSAALCQGLSQPLRVGGGGGCPGALHTLRAKAQIYWESPSPCQDQLV